MNQLPNNIEAEQAVIGGVLVDPKAMAQIGDVVRSGDFTRQAHRVIFDAALRLDGKGLDVDLLTIMESLRQSGDLEAAGGMPYLGELARDTPSAANIRAYAEIVRDRSIERQLIQAGMGFQSIVAEPGDVREKLDKAQQSVLDIGRESGNGPVLVRESMPGWVAGLDERYQSGGNITGLATGFCDVDRMTGGMQAGDLIILAGRPSMGKSALMMDIAGYVADSGAPVLVFSLEMPTSQLIDRQVSARARVPLMRIRSGKLEDADWPKVTATSSEVAALPLIIDDSGGLTVTDVRARSRRVKQRHGVGLIVLDYLQLMSGSGENRTQQISEISRGLKLLAKDLSIPVIALSQLNRSLEQRQNKRPIMSDLRESGAIEQDADLIAFVYRDEVYNEDSPDRGTAELIIAKQRNGPTGTVRLAYQGDFTHFENLAHNDYLMMRAANEPPVSVVRGMEDL